MVTKPTDKTGTNAVPSTEYNWLVDLIDGTGVASANLKWTVTSGVGLTITNSGTDHTIFLDVNDNAIGLNIDSEATTATKYGINSNTGQGATAGHFVYGADANGAIYLANNPDGSLGTFLVTRNLSSASTASAVARIIQDNSGDDQPALSIQNDGTGNGLFIDQNGDGIGLYIDSEATTAGSYGLYVDVGTGGAHAARILTSTNDYYQKSLQTTSQGSHFFYRDLTSATTAGPVVFIEQDNAGDDQATLKIQNDGSGVGIWHEQNDGTNPGLYVYSNAGGPNSRELVLFQVDNATFDEEVLKLINDGTGDTLFLDVNGDARGLVIDSEATTTNVIYVESVNTDGNVVHIKNTANHADAGNAIFKVEETNASSVVALGLFSHNALGPCIKLESTQDVEVIDFDGVTDGGTSHTTVAGSVKVQMPNGSIGYINLYT